MLCFVQRMRDELELLLCGVYQRLDEVEMSLAFYIYEISANQLLHFATIVCVFFWLMVALVLRTGC